MNATCRSIQDKLLLYVESLQNGTPELTGEEMARIEAHLQTCEHCRLEQEAIERNVDRLHSIPVVSPSEHLAARCLPGSLKQKRSPYAHAFRYAVVVMIVLVLIATGYVTGVLHQQSIIPTQPTQPVPMTVLFQQQNELIQLLEEEIQQSGIHPQTEQGITLVGLKQSAYVMEHIYESSSRDIVVRESIRQLTEHNIQLLRSLTQYIDEYDQENGIPMQDI